MNLINTPYQRVLGTMLIKCVGDSFLQILQMKDRDKLSFLIPSMGKVYFQSINFTGKGAATRAGTGPATMIMVRNVNIYCIYFGQLLVNGTESKRNQGFHKPVLTGLLRFTPDSFLNLDVRGRTVMDHSSK